MGGVDQEWTLCDPPGRLKCIRATREYVMWRWMPEQGLAMVTERDPNNEHGWATWDNTMFLTSAHDSVPDTVRALILLLGG